MKARGKGLKPTGVALVKGNAWRVVAVFTYMCVRVCMNTWRGVAWRGVAWRENTVLRRLLAHPRKAPLQVSKHELQRLGPRLLMVSLDAATRSGQHAQCARFVVVVSCKRQAHLRVPQHSAWHTRCSWVSAAVFLQAIAMHIHKTSEGSTQQPRNYM